MLEYILENDKRCSDDFVLNKEEVRQLILNKFKRALKHQEECEAVKQNTLNERK